MRPKYIWNYPRAALGRLVADAPGYALSLTIFVAGPAFGIWCGLSTPWWWVGLPLSALLGVVFIWGVRGVLHEVRDRFGLRVVPQFERKLPEDPGTYFSGHRIARQLRVLDTLAIKKNLPPLSSFGLLVSQWGDDESWNDAASMDEALRQLVPLVDDSVGVDGGEIKAELSRLHEAVHSAATLAVRCRLVVVSGTGMNAMLWNRLRESGF